MSSEVEALRGEIDHCIADLERAQKQLKRRSTLSFAERRDLAAKAAKAAADLSEHRARLADPPEGTTDEALAEQVREARSALENAAAILGRIEAVQPAATHLLGKRLPGDYRR